MTKTESVTDRIIRCAYRAAKTAIEEQKQSQLMSVAIILSKDDKIDFLGMPWHDDQQKEIMVMALQMVLDHQQAKAYAIMSEAWVITRAATDYDSKVRPADCPDRKEVVQITAQERGKKTATGCAEILHPSDGIRRLGPLEIHSYDMASGLMANLLDPEPAVH